MLAIITQGVVEDKTERICFYLWPPNLTECLVFLGEEVQRLVVRSSLFTAKELSNNHPPLLLSSSGSVPSHIR